MIWSYEKMPDTGSSWREEGPAPKTKTKIGITLTLCPEDIPDKLLEDCALFHFGHPTLMRHMYEEEGAGGRNRCGDTSGPWEDGCMELGAKVLLMKCGRAGL